MTPMATMQAMPATFAPPRRSRWRRWRVALILLAVVILTPLALIYYSNIATRRAWEAAEAEAEADLPRWRLLELEEDRAAIPDAENSALHMIALRRKAGNFYVSSSPQYEKLFEKLTPTAQLNEKQSKFIRGEFAKIPGPRLEARKLKDMPRGRFPVVLTDDYINTLLPDHQNARQVAEWLQHDAMLLAHDGKYDEAIESCHAILNASRAFDGDPFLVALLIRTAMQHIAVTSLERVLAQGQASEPALRAIQPVLEREYKESGLLAAMRGERAGFHLLFDNMRQGKVEVDWRILTGMMAMSGAPKGTWQDDVLFFFTNRYPSVTLKYYPELLQFMNRNVETAKLPTHERLVQCKQINLDIQSSKNPLVRLMAPATGKVNEAEIRSQAILRSAMVAVACERYRLQHRNSKNENAWPATLNDLVKARLLDAVPLDPFDGKPIRYVRNKDGIVVYSVGFDLTDDKGNINRERVLDPGVDIGFRVWNVERRRQPPPPVAP